MTWATGKFSTVRAKTRIPEPTMAGITSGKVMRAQHLGQR